MGFKERIEASPVVFLLGALAAGFTSGLGTYKAILEIAHLEVIPAQELISLREDAAKRGEVVPGLSAFPQQDEDCCIVSGKLLTRTQEPEVGARVYAYLLHSDKVGETLTDSNGYYAMRLRKGYIVNISYDSANRKYTAWTIADKLPVDKNLRLPVAVVGVRSDE